MLAGAQGGLCNASELGTSLGTSYHTVAHLLDVLEGVFLIRRLAPYASNVRKRLVKAPKVYVRDSGLLHSLLGIPFTERALFAHVKAGASFETFCIEQILGHARLTEPEAEGFFYRTHGGLEVDLVLRRRGTLLPIEIKLGLTPPNTRSLETAMADLGARRGYVVSAGTGAREIRKGIVLCGLAELLQELGGAAQGRR